MVAQYLNDPIFRACQDGHFDSLNSKLCPTLLIVHVNNDVRKTYEDILSFGMFFVYSRQVNEHFLD